MKSGRIAVKINAIGVFVLKAIWNADMIVKISCWCEKMCSWNTREVSLTVRAVNNEHEAKLRSLNIIAICVLRTTWLLSYLSDVAGMRR